MMSGLEFNDENDTTAKLTRSNRSYQETFNAPYADGNKLEVPKDSQNRR